MADQKTRPAPEALAKHRMAQNFSPGQWWLGELRGEDGVTVRLWSEVSIVMHKEQIGTRRKFVHVLGTSTDGRGAELVAYRGDEFLSLTAAQARKCGLVLPPRDEAEGVDRG